MTESAIIQKFASSFMKPSSRERAVYELKSSKKRMKFVSKIGALPEFFQLNKFIKMKKGKLISFDKISRETLCYIISGFGEYDRLIIPFEKAVRHCHFGASGTIVYDFYENRLIYHEELSFGSPTVYFANGC